MQHLPTQLDSIGLQLRIRPLSNPGANKVEMIEEIQNRSDHPICFALRSWNRQILQLACIRTIGANRKLAYYPEPRDLSLDGFDAESSLQVVEGFVSGGTVAEGGEVIQPSEITKYPSESFTILRAGLFRIYSEWSVDILDVREAPCYKVVGKCTLRSNILDLDVWNDDQQGEKKVAEQSPTNDNSTEARNSRSKRWSEGGGNVEREEEPSE